MTSEERRTVLVTASILLAASLIRLGWESRPVPPIFPADTTAYQGLVTEAEQVAVDEARRRTPLAPGETIDPNRADEVELARLPGVGPALAARIVAGRESGGAFRSAADLERIPGIGPATLMRLGELLDFSDPPVLPGIPGGRDGGQQVRVDLNRAGATELETLPGVGPAMARRIIEVRGVLGRFDRIDDLLAVPGIGPATLERLRPLVSTGETYVYPP
jgi:competence protein ComEA